MLFVACQRIQVYKLFLEGSDDSIEKSFMNFEAGFKFRFKSRFEMFYLENKQNEKH